MKDQSPHSSRQWPYNAHSYRIASLREALTGADTLAQMLNADNNIRESVGDSDSPETEDQPFNARDRGGLFAALAVCLYRANVIAEDLEKVRVTP